MHARIEEFLESMRGEGRESTARGYAHSLAVFEAWLQKRNLDLLMATFADLQAYQRFLADEYLTPANEHLNRSTQSTRLAALKSFYQWLEDRELVPESPARLLKLPKVSRRTVNKDALDLQEATALVQTQAGIVSGLKPGTLRWARQYRNLALLCLALASGKRREIFRTLKVSDLDLKRHELRVAHEKGRIGRVVPVAAWAVQICALYIAEARQRLFRGRQDAGFLFPGAMTDQLGGNVFMEFLKSLQIAAAAENLDLEGLQTKHLTPHVLRVSYATLLFSNGCNIRSINELMNHSRLTTTAKYTPIPLEDLRRVCRAAHPRA